MEGRNDGKNIWGFLADTRNSDLGSDNFRSNFLVGHMLWLNNSWGDLVDFAPHILLAPLLIGVPGTGFIALGIGKLAGKSS